MATADCGFSGRPDRLANFGPTLWVQIGFDPNFRDIKGFVPEIPPEPYPALVDTGASDSCIDSQLAVEIGLPIIDRRQVSGVHGAFAVNVHLAQIYDANLDIILHGRFSGVHLAAGGQPHRALIGRDFLRNFSMLYEGRTGNVTISR